MNDGLDKAFDIVESIDDVAPKPEVKKPPKKVEAIDQVQDDMNMHEETFMPWWIKDKKLSTVLLIWLCLLITLEHTKLLDNSSNT